MTRGHDAADRALRHAEYAFDHASFLLIEDLAAFAVAIGQQVGGVAVDFCFFMFAAQHTQHRLGGAFAQWPHF